MTNGNVDLDYPPESTVGDQQLRDLPDDADAAACASRLLLSKDVERRIAEIAYELFLARGSQPGHDLDDWLLAEKIIYSRLAARAKRAGEPSHAQA
jgi:hypothetical protein